MNTTIGGIVLLIHLLFYSNKKNNSRRFSLIQLSFTLFKNSLNKNLNFFKDKNLGSRFKHILSTIL